jgi:hypothetical protein
MKGDCNCGYYAIISQIRPNFWRKHSWSLKRYFRICKKIIYEISGKVLQYNNKINENNYREDFFSLENFNIEENN